ncbi:Lipase 1 [Eumeta japonica]|uniref:Lipase 1 n=1 Tax=Eumeta variegata TaxID=151549 RepID=A0A4C1XNW2_EUMVA|nr:Lipase 1 [Eumeta japonica]
MVFANEAVDIHSTFVLQKRPFGRITNRTSKYLYGPQLITSAGYPCEHHRVTTTDGYILQIHRIPAGRRAARRAGDNAKGKRPVLVVHGLLGSSGDFVIMGPERSLGYILADEGYDVWLGNLRGNDYTSHENLTKSDAEFWNFSFHEHGGHDVTAIIDKVLNVTGLPRLFYVGYSMGTTSFFTMMSQRPEYNDKVVAFVALAPAVYLNNIRPLAEMGLRTYNLTGMFRSQGIHYLSIPRDLMETLASGICNVRRREDDVCMRLVYSILGEDYEQNDWDMTPVILARMQPASLRQLEHFGKIAITGVFTEWNNGILTPPKLYSLKNVRRPVALFYGKNDKLTEKEVKQHMANKKHKTKTEMGKFSGLLQKVFPPTSGLSSPSNEDTSVTAAELATTYHSVKHNLSYNSQDYLLYSIPNGKFIYVYPPHVAVGGGSFETIDDGALIRRRCLAAEKFEATGLS